MFCSMSCSVVCVCVFSVVGIAHGRLRIGEIGLDVVDRLRARLAVEIGAPRFATAPDSSPARSDRSPNRSSRPARATLATSDADGLLVGAHAVGDGHRRTDLRGRGLQRRRAAVFAGIPEHGVRRSAVHQRRRRGIIGRRTGIDPLRRIGTEEIIGGGDGGGRRQRGLGEIRRRRWSSPPADWSRWRLPKRRW